MDEVKQPEIIPPDKPNTLVRSTPRLRRRQRGQRPKVSSSQQNADKTLLLALGILGAAMVVTVMNNNLSPTKKDIERWGMQSDIINGMIVLSILIAATVYFLKH